jgi:hypothetical protein
MNYDFNSTLQPRYIAPDTATPSLSVHENLCTVIPYYTVLLFTATECDWGKTRGYILGFIREYVFQNESPRCKYQSNDLVAQLLTTMGLQ